MNNRVGLIILTLISLGLAAGLVVTNKKATEQQRKDAETIGALSNKWVRTSGELDDERQVAAMLKKDLEGQKGSYSELTNSFTRLSGNLSQVSTTLASTEASLRNTEAEVKKRDAKIAELENQNQALDQQAADLNHAITNLTTQIDQTQRKLAASEGDKAYLEKELKRLVAEKAALERQFNDLVVLKAQVAKLKDELSIVKRVEWIRRGLLSGSDEKGAARLVRGLPTGRATYESQPKYDLNVEMSSQGDARIVPPQTNSPAAPAEK
jgi:septal ring factor EnvC (AmiA/AmiB activator)